MLASGVALGVAAGWIAGGRQLARLGDLRIRWWPLLAAAVALRLAAPLAGDLAAVAYVVGFAGVVAVAVADRRLPGMTLIAAGAALNCIVVAANGGMPVDQAAMAAAGTMMPADRLHLQMTDASRLAVLADRIPLAPFRNVYSIGDVLLALGGFWLPFAWMRRR